MKADKKDLLVVVDMQNDFVTGPLGTKEARAIVPGVVDFVKNFNGQRIFTMDTHTSDYLSTQEGRNLPVEHCIKDTDGWELIPELRAVVTEDDIILHKNSFGSLKLAKLVSEGQYANIFFVGVCTGICVISNAVIAKAADTEAAIHIVKDLCACVTPESHETAINAMRLLQMDIVE